MGSSQNYGCDLEMATLTTVNLKDRLNRIYDAMHGQSHLTQSSGLFDYLWDLKELALLEGRSSVQVPVTWLAELEDGFKFNLSGRTGR